jgi:hypothetical protein
MLRGFIWHKIRVRGWFYWRAVINYQVHRRRVIVVSSWTTVSFLDSFTHIVYRFSVCYYLYLQTKGKYFNDPGISTYVRLLLIVTSIRIVSWSWNMCTLKFWERNSRSLIKFTLLAFAWRKYHWVSLHRALVTTPWHIQSRNAPGFAVFSSRVISISRQFLKETSLAFHSESVFHNCTCSSHKLKWHLVRCDAV